MKIRHPLAIKSAAFLLSLGVRGWMSTVRVEEHVLDPRPDPRSQSKPFLYLFWHENILVPAARYVRFRIPVLASQHRDGELVVQVIRFLGGSAIRGSSTRGGAKAIRQMLAHLQSRALAITPDGPRGPRRVLQQGAVFLASHAQIEVVPVGIHFKNAWRLRSWDQFAIPKPFSRARVILGHPIAIPANLTSEQLSPYLQLCQEGMNATQAIAEGLTALPET